MDKKNSSTHSEKKNNVVSAIFKIDLHCVGCVNRIVKYAKSVHGVESVNVEFEVNKLTVNGRMDPEKVKTKLELKTRKKVDLLSPQPNKKDKENNIKKNSNEKPNEKRPKQLQVTTTTLKVQLHCQGCIEKINKIVSRTKGVLDKTIDKEKDHVIVIGTMDVNVLVECLKNQLRRNVEVVPSKKEKEGGGDGKANAGGDSKANAGGDGKANAGGDGKANPGGDGKANAGGDGKANAGGGGGANERKKGKKGGDEDSKRAGGENGGHKMEFMSVPIYGVIPVVNHGSQFVYGYPGYNGHLHAPQIFSDENPNACSVM